MVRPLLGGAANLRLIVDCVSFSYSTDVLLGRFCFRAPPEAHESFAGFMLRLELLKLLDVLLLRSELWAGMIVVCAARWNALAMFTDVSLRGW